MEIIRKKDLIYKLLLENPNFRNNDQALISHIWAAEIPNLANINGSDVLSLIANNKLSNPVSIWRTRQKIQQHIPAVRGTLYNKRKEAGEQIKIEIVNEEIDLSWHI